MPSPRAIILVLVAMAAGLGAYWYFDRSSHPLEHHTAPPSPRTKTTIPTVLPTSKTPKFGINLAEIADYSRAWAFVDVFKSSRAWIERGAGPYSFDARGWPKLDRGQTVETLMVRELEGHYPPGRYIVTWKGRGEVHVDQFDVTRIVDRKPGRLEIEVAPADGGLKLVVASIDSFNPVHDIRVWMPGFEQAASPFHPLFLKRLQPFAVIRFMKWQRTEVTKERTWAERAKLDDARWSTPAGAPIEIMIDLANTLGANPWFCMPHLADDDYIRQFARLVKERLRADLKVYVEYSNEVWNGMYDCMHYADDEGKRLRLGEAPFARFYARRSVEIFRIWEDEFRGHERLVRVLASQFVNSWLSEQILKFEDAYRHADALAVAPYFGYEFGRPEAAQAVSRLNVEDLLNRVAAEVDGPNRDQIRAQAELARKYGLELIAYEGGQHLAGVLGAENNQAMTALFIAANRSPRMAQISQRHYEHWFAAGGGVYAAFNYVQTPSKWGAWGVLEFQDQPIADAPKYRAILEMLKK